MKLSMMDTTQRDREFVTDLHADRSGLGEPQMMRVAGLAAADQARLLCHEFQMIFVADTTWLRKGKRTFVNTC